MQHLRRITKSAPAQAGIWQEIICTLAITWNAVQAFTGGSTPFTLYIEDKCVIPEANQDSGADQET